METVGEALQYCSDQLQQAPVYFGHGCDNAWDEAVQLVLTVMELPVDADERVLSYPVSGRQQVRIDSLLTRRIEERVPMPYLLGRAWFAGLVMHCDERAIVPRSPIGELIVRGFAPWYRNEGPARVLDLCCGGGAIGLAAAYHYPDWRVDLVDLDSEALSLAVSNCQLLEVSDRVELIQSDLFSAVAGRRYDLILSNPPYVDERDLAGMPEEYHHEPVLALGAGADGLDLTRRILAGAAEHLNPGGALILEVGNSWEALEAAYPSVPFTWIEFEQGGHGVFTLSARELEEHRASLSR